jgi:hypothetical protein
MTSKPVGGAKKKLNRADYMFNQKTGETLVKKPGDIAGLEFAIRYLTDCHASVFDQTAAVRPQKTQRFSVSNPIFLYRLSSTSANTLLLLWAQ